MVEFKVTVLDQSMRIKDNELNFFNGWFASADTFLLINETVCTSANCVPTNPDVLAYKEVLVDILPGQPDIFVEQDIQNFLPQQAIWVAKFIVVETYDGEPVGITNFQQFFSQEVVSVPEPGTLVMIALGLIGVGFGRRRLGWATEGEPRLLPGMETATFSRSGRGYSGVLGQVEIRAMAAEECGRSLLDPLPPDEPHNKREDGRTSLVTIGG